MTNELMHYGVPGMKWGVRRYQNYNGSYTKAGLKRYYASKERTDNARNAYKEARLRKKQGLASKHQVKEARSEYKKENSRLIQDYRHLKSDYLGDQGKRMYSEGKRITSNSTRTQLIVLGSGLAARYALNSQDSKKGIAIIASLAAVEVGARAIEEYQNKRLRVYYGHTSNY